MRHKLKSVVVILMLFVVAETDGGPYTEAGVNGYIGNDWKHANPLPPEQGGDADAVINPIFRGWAAGFRDYLPSDNQWWGGGIWNDPNKALGPATGNNFDIVSLGDMNATEIADGCEPGRITLIFGDPCNPNDPNHIRNVNGYDFAVFENGSISNYDTSGGPVAGQMFAELGYVEVSSDGNHFARFAAVSLTPQQTGPYGTVDITNIYNLLGKHPNCGGICVGTPFDLAELAENPDVVSGVVDINNICYVRIVDIPGSGDFFDNARANTDPNTWPNYTSYDSNHPVYDAWVTWGSGGLDLEAVGVLKEQEYAGDINLDGIVDFYDLELMVSDWLVFWGQYEDWLKRSDISQPRDNKVDMRDFAVWANQWGKKEIWRMEADQW